MNLLAAEVDLDLAVLAASLMVPVILRNRLRQKFPRRMGDVGLLRRQVGSASPVASVQMVRAIQPARPDEHFFVVEVNPEDFFVKTFELIQAWGKIHAVELSEER